MHFFFVRARIHSNSIGSRKVQRAVGPSKTWINSCRPIRRRPQFTDLVKHVQRGELIINIFIVGELNACTPVHRADGSDTGGRFSQGTGRTAVDCSRQGSGKHRFSVSCMRAAILRHEGCNINYVMHGMACMHIWTWEFRPSICSCETDLEIQTSTISQGPHMLP